METAAEHVKCERDIYREAIEKWGAQSQIDMAVEEMGELLQKLIHYKRCRCDEVEVSEEIADVMLMAEEMAYLFGRKHVIYWLEIKKEIVTRRLEEEEEVFRPSKEMIGENNDENLYVERP